MNVLIKSARKNVTTAGTAEALFSSSTAVLDITIKANAGNTNNVYVGDSTVSSTTGFTLDAGQSISLGDLIKNSGDQTFQADKIFIDVDTNGEGVELIYIERNY